MKIKTMLQYCLPLVVVTITSCAKKELPAEAAQNQGQEKGLAKTSSTVYFGKSTTALQTSIPINPGYQHKRMYTVGPFNAQAGDVISVHFQQETTFANWANENVMVASGVAIASNNTAITGAMSGFYGWACSNMGTNTTTDESGTEVVSRTGSWTVTSAAAAAPIYVNAKLYGSTLSSPGTSYPLTIPAGNYGELVVVVERGVTRTEILPQNFVALACSGVTFVNKSLGPYNIPANTQVDVRYELSPTSDSHMLAPNIQRAGRFVTQETSASANGGTQLIRPIMRGITHAEHHASSSSAGGKFFGSATNGVYFNASVYAQGWTDGHGLDIDLTNGDAYGNFVVEMRPSASGKFFEDITANVDTLDATPRVLYSVGPITTTNGQIVEVRYNAAFVPSGKTSVVSKIIRVTAASPAAAAAMTTGTDVQGILARVFNNSYGYNSMHQSTAEQIGTGAANQYYNVVAWRTGGPAKLPVTSWGELEAVQR